MENVVTTEPRPDAPEGVELGKRSGYRWSILFMLSLMALITFIDRTNISIAAPRIVKEFGFTKTQMGLIFGVFGWAYSLGQLPGGWLGDTFGPRKVLAAVVIFWSLMTMATAHAVGFASMIAIRFIFGLGEAACWPAATRAMQFWYPKSERGRANGITHSCGQFATTIVPIIGVAIMTAWGWRAIFHIFGLVGMVWAVAWYFMYRDRPEDHKSVNAAELAYIQDRAQGTKSVVKAKVAIPWGTILTSSNMWFMALAYSGYGYGAYFFWYWMPTYLMERQHISLKSMGFIAPFPLFAGAMGMLLGGVVTDFVYKKTKNLRWSRRAVCIGGMLGASLTMVPVALLSQPVLVVLCMALCNGLISMAVAPSWAASMDVAGDFSGSVSSVMNMVGQGAGAVSAIIFGALVQRGMWLAPFYITSGVMLGAALLWAFVINPEKLVTEKRA